MQIKCTLSFPTGTEYHNLIRINKCGLQKALKKFVRCAYRAGAKVMIADDRAMAVYPHYEVYWQVV